MPTSYVLERRWCWPGIDTSVEPPCYKLGAMTLRIFADGLEEHIARVADEARMRADSTNNARLSRIMREMGGVPHAG